MKGMLECIAEENKIFSHFICLQKEMLNKSGITQLMNASADYIYNVGSLAGCGDTFCKRII